MKSRVTVVVPCYNEEKRFPGEKFLSFARQWPRYDFLLVDDGSSDQTAEVLERVKSACQEQFEVLNLKPNGGKAEAVRRGFLKALEGDAEFIAFWDADLATPLEALPLFLNVMDGKTEIEMVMGSRVKLMGWDIQRRLIRHYLGRIFATCASGVLNLRVYDTQCGAKMFRVNPALRKIVSEPFLSKWIFDVEWLARYLKIRGLAAGEAEQHIYEQPLPKWTDVHGSKVKPTDFFRAFAELVQIYFRYRK